MAYRASKQRDMIMEYLKTVEGHQSAEQIFEALNQQLSLATVYRNLGILSDMKMIKKIALPEGYVYDKTCNPHYHFYCTKCHTLYDLSLPYQTQFDEIEESDVIGKIENHEITYHGVCKNCL